MSVKIDQAFISTFINAGFGLPIAHENFAYSPEPDTAYVQIRTLDNDITGWGLSQTNVTDGIFRALLHYPAGSGAIAAKTKADEIFAAFPIGSEITYGGVNVTIRTHNRQPGVSENGWYKIIVDIGYWAALER